MEKYDDIVILPVGFTPVDSLMNPPDNPRRLTAPELRRQQLIDSLKRPVRFVICCGIVVVRYVVRHGIVAVSVVAAAFTVAKVPFP